MRLPRQRTPRRIRLTLSPLTSVALVAAAVFALVGIGSPLLGHGVFAATDQLVARSPYVDAGFAGTRISNGFLDDTYNAELPSEILFGQSIRDGSVAFWNPYISGGSPLSAIPNSGVFSPLALPFWVLPGWLAPAYQKLLETVVAMAGCYFFLRRLRLRPPAALFGGTVFASSAFMVVWTNWPQTRVAAVIPWVFWALERLIQRRRVTDAVLLAAAVGVMLLGGFPAVTAFTLLTAGAYALARSLAEHRLRRHRALAVILAAGAAVVGGLAIAAVQLLPFRAFYSSWLIEGRGQTGQHLSPADLASSFAPWVYGGVSPDSSDPIWSQDANIVEASSYVGAAALVLIVVALATVRAGRTLLPRAAWITVVSAAAAWLLLIYVGGPLALVEHLPIFSSNFIGRARSVLGFLLAVLAAVGFDLLLRPRARTATWRAWWRTHAAAIAVAVAAIGVTVWLVILARTTSARADAAGTPANVTSHVAFANRQLLVGVVLLAVAVAAASVLLWRRRRRAGQGTAIRSVAAGVLLALVIGQGLAFVGPYWPRPDRSTFYPATDVQRYLAAHLDHERFAGSAQAMPMGGDVPLHLRGLQGHAFMNARLAALLRAMPENPVPLATHILFPTSAAVATSPVLDRLAGRYFITSPRGPVFGAPHPPSASAAAITLTPGGSVTAPVPTPGPLRAVGILPVTGGLPADASVSVSVTDAHGVRLATGRRLATELFPGVVFYVPVAGEAIPAGTHLTATITLHARVPLAVAGNGTGGPVAIGSVSPLPDGLRLVYAGSAIIYERINALLRIRWAARAVVQPDQAARVALLASGALAPDQVVLDGPGPLAAGRPGTVRVETDGNDRIEATVSAAGSGYLVVADALQQGWSASVDGRPAPLVAADEAVVAVPVGAGEHRVELRYDAPYRGLGTWLSALALLTAAALLIVDSRLARRRTNGPRATFRTAARHIGGPGHP